MASHFNYRAIGSVGLKTCLIAIITFFVGLGICIYLQGVAGEVFTDEADVVRHKLWIVESGGKCELVFRGEKNSGRLPLGPKPPCRFVTVQGGGLQFYAFPDINVKASLLVVGTPSKPDPKMPRTLDKNLYCGDEILGSYHS